MDETEALRNGIRMLENRIGDASMLLADWDGHYDPETKKGNAEGLANLVEEAFVILQGRSWRDERKEEDARGQMMLWGDA